MKIREQSESVQSESRGLIFFSRILSSADKNGTFLQHIFDSSIDRERKNKIIIGKKTLDCVEVDNIGKVSGGKIPHLSSDLHWRVFVDK